MLVDIELKKIDDLLASGAVSGLHMRYHAIADIARAIGPLRTKLAASVPGAMRIAAGWALHRLGDDAGRAAAIDVATRTGDPVQRSREGSSNAARDRGECPGREARRGATSRTCRGLAPAGMPLTSHGYHGVTLLRYAARRRYAPAATHSGNPMTIAGK